MATSEAIPQLWKLQAYWIVLF